MEKKETAYSYIKNEIMKRQENGEVVFDPYEIADMVPMELVDKEKALEWYMKKMVRVALNQRGYRSIGDGIYERTEKCGEADLWEIQESQTVRAKGHTVNAIKLMEMAEHRK